MNGMAMKPPRYYDNLLKSSEDFASDYVEFLRYKKALKGSDDNTPDRLADRESAPLRRLKLK